MHICPRKMWKSDLLSGKIFLNHCVVYPFIFLFLLVNCLWMVSHDWFSCSTKPWLLDSLANNWHFHLYTEASRNIELILDSLANNWHFHLYRASRNIELIITFFSELFCVKAINMDCLYVKVEWYNFKILFHCRISFTLHTVNSIVTCMIILYTKVHILAMVVYY